MYTYISVHLYIYVYLYTCKHEIFSQPWQIIILSSLCMSFWSEYVTIFLIPTFLFSATRYLSRDPFVCLSVHRRIYLSILSSRPFIPLRSLTCLWSLQVLSFTPLSLFWNFRFSATILWAHIIFARTTIPTAILAKSFFYKSFYVSMCSCTYLKFYYEDAHI